MCFHPDFPAKIQDFIFQNLDLQLDFLRQFFAQNRPKFNVGISNKLYEIFFLMCQKMELMKQ